MGWIEPGTDAATGTVKGVLRTQADTDGDTVFVMADDRAFTYSQVEAMSNSYARGLADLGIGAGDSAVIMMANSPEFVNVALGLTTLGAFWVPVDIAYKLDSLVDAVGRTRAGVLIVDAEFLPRIEQVWSQLTVKHVLVHGGPGAAPGTPALPGATVHPLRTLETFDPAPLQGEIDYRATASVMWTSGTTGMPKGVIQPNFTWLYNSAAMNRARDVQGREIFHNVLPMHHSASWILGTYAALQSGGTVGIDRHFSASGYWDRVRHYGATQIATIGALQIFLWQQPRRDDDQDNPARRAMMTPLPPDIIGPFCERFGLEAVLQLSGQTEMMGWSYCDDRKPTWKPGSCGMPRPDLDMVLLDDNDQPVPTGEIGEICIRPQVAYSLFGGYYDNPEATLRSFGNLWYHSGDLGRFDEDGELFFIDRKADFMRYKGRNISSMQVEAYIAKHPGVKEVAVHGVRSPELDSEDEVKACVVRNPDSEVSAEELARFVNDHAPHYLVPRYIEFLQEFPRTPTGRIRKNVLREKPLSPATWDAKAAGFVVNRD